MNTKILKMQQSVKSVESIYRCPICNSKMKVENISIVCKRRHCFDLSSKGYINFMPSNKFVKYSKELFENRKEIFDNGFYDKVKEEIENVMLKYTTFNKDVNGINLLDVGCGEGFFSRKILENKTNKINTFAMDISKDAVAIASKLEKGANFIVADLSNIPISDDSIDVILNILTPACYKEFIRVLKKDGIVIKIVPGTEYLKQIRQSMLNQLENKEYSNKKVLDYFDKKIKPIYEKRVKYSLTLTKEQLQCFLKMTPMTMNVDVNSLNVDNIENITIDLYIIVGKKA
ncbi:MAG: methyltransferase domain-containing protein [Clostridia bacterium]